METERNTNLFNPNEFRMGLILAGIATAVICVMALLFETRSTSHKPLNSLKSVPTGLIVKTINLMVESHQF